jgi:hypothetical protein
MSRFAVFVTLLAVAALVECGKWHQLTPTGPYFPVGRYFHSQSGVGDHAYVFGGTDGSNFFSDTFRYSINKVSVDLVAEDGSGPSERAGHCSVYLHAATKSVNLPDNRTVTVILRNTTLFVFGGFDGTNFLNDVWLLDLSTGLWAQAPAGDNVPSGRAHHTCAVLTNGEEYQVAVFGGFDGSNYLGPANGGLQYFTGGRANSWEVPTDNSPSGFVPDARALITGVNQGHELYVYGGQNSDGCLNDTWVWNFHSQSWHFLPVMTGPPALCGYTANSLQGGDYDLFGGFTDCAKGSDEMWHLSHSSKTWAKVSEPIQHPPARGGTVSTVHGQGYLIYGGIHSAPSVMTTGARAAGTVYDDLWYYVR